MFTIGFTTKFYTLWDVTVESVINEYGRKGERVTAAYIKNISMDEKTARAKYPDAPVDMSLRGHSSFTRMNWEPMPLDVFPCGVYAGKPIAECKDSDYMYWAVYSNMLCGESCDIAKAALIERGFCAYYEGEFMKADEVAKLEREDAAFADLVAAIDRVGFVIVESATNIRREDDERGKHYVSYTKNNVTIEWPENMIERFSYNGYEYYLPVKGGKAKRIKGKNLKVVTDSYRIEGRCMAIVDAEYFEILK